jgi:uncharacterized protein (TIGR03067 family)
LKICLGKNLPSVKGEQRPKRFEVDPASGYALFALRRYQPSADEQAMRGAWLATSMIVDGNPLPEKTRREQSPRGFSCSFSDSGAHLDLHDKYPGWLWALDPAKEPKTITLVQQQDVFEKKQRLGIYRLDGDRLEIAYRESGPRPEKFESPPGSGITLLVLQRSKP